MRLLRTILFSLPLASIALLAESKNPADYPLRIHIFGRNETNFYHDRMLDESKGEGRANLFENSEARGVDFSFECPEKLRASFGFETYSAKWKKPGQELVILLPVFGKSNTYFTCNLKTQIKDYAYFAHDGKMGSEPIAAFKTWMVKHEYDPEHGKNMPVKAETPPASAPQAAAPAAHQ
jgi:hypothetical protein